MLQVCFDCYGSYTTDSVYQWDLNRRLAIRGLDYASAPAIHFSNKKSAEALVVQSTIEDGVIYCDVPNILLQEPYDIVGYVCESLDQEVTTYETIRIPVKPRVKPADYAYSDNVEILTYYSLMAEISSVKVSNEKGLNSMDASKASKAELSAVKSEVDNDLSKVEGEVATERARIDQLVASPEIGEGDLEKEVGDLRIDTKGTTHGSAGTAVRLQIQELDSKIDANVSNLSSEIEEVSNNKMDKLYSGNTIELSYSKTDGKLLNVGYLAEGDAGYGCYIDYSLNGEMYLDISGHHWNDTVYPLYFFIDKDNTVIERYSGDANVKISNLVVKVPANATRVVVNGANYEPCDLLERETVDLQKFYEETEGDILNVDVFGDSIVYGSLTNNAGAFVGQSDYNYPSMLGKNKRFNVVNHANPGQGFINTDYHDTIGLAEISNADLSKSNVVIINWGINDQTKYNANLGTLDSKDSTTILGSLYQCVSKVFEKNPNVTVIIVGRIASSSGYGAVCSLNYGDTNSSFNAYGLNKAYSEFCEKYHLPCIDMLDNPINQFNGTSLSLDGTHLTDKGYELLAHYMVAKILSIVS